MIVTPSSGGYQTLARRIQRGIKEHSGVDVEIKIDKYLQEEDYRRRNLIVLGQMRNNRAVLRLYREHYAFVDDRYPGADGYVLRTIHNPYGYGRNVVLLGGSDLEGVSKAARRFLEILEDGETISLGRIIETRSIHNVAVNPAEVERRPRRAEEKIMPCVASGFFYYQTGDLRWSEVFKRLYYGAIHEREFPEPFWGWNFILAWDLVEESPTFTNEERLEITNKVLSMTENAAKIGYMRNLTPDQIRWNHQTFNALILFYAARYFKKYYNLEEAEEWGRLADLCFRAHAKSSRSWDEGQTYSCLTPRHMMNYSLTKGDLEHFENGSAKKMADWAIMIHDNLSNIVAFGDAGAFSRAKRSDVYAPIWAKAAWYYKDGRYKWMIKKVTGNSYLLVDDYVEKALSTGLCPIYEGTYDVEIPPVEPVDMLGVKAVAPIEKSFYKAEVEQPSRIPGTYLEEDKPTKPEVPWEKTFDKITFRESFSPSREYLLLDGTTAGQHKHQDGNSILWFTDKNRIFLIDSGYTQALNQRRHNTLLVLRNRKSGEPPKFAALDFLEDLGGVGCTRTSLLGYNGTRWSRNILWRKGKFFLVIDDLEAEEDAEYDFRCLWRILGRTDLERNHLISEQKGVEFHMQNAGGISSLTYKERDAFKDKSLWEGYEYADDLVTNWVQRIVRRLAAGEHTYFINLFYTKYSREEKAVSLQRVSHSTAYLTFDREEALAGVNGFKGDGMETDAALYYVSPERLFLVNTKSFTWEERTLRSSKPVSISIERGVGTITAEEDTEISIYNGGEKLLIDGKTFGKEGKNMVSLDLPKGRHKIRLDGRRWILPFDKVRKMAEEVTPPAERLPPTEEGEKMERLYSVKLGEPVTAIFTADVDGDGEDEVLAGTEGGVLSALKGLEEIWRFSTNGKINAIHVSDIDGDGVDEVLVGSSDCHLYVLNSMGGLKWKFKSLGRTIKLWGPPSPIRQVTASDIDRDGKPEVLIADDSWMVYALSNCGEIKWKFDAYAHSPTVLEVCDVDSDGMKEVIEANDYFHLHVIDYKGRLKWLYYTGRESPIIASLAIDDIDGDGEKEVIVAASGDYVHVIRSKSRVKDRITRDRGQLKWKANVGGDANAVEVMDIDGDGRVEVLVGSENFYLYCLSSDGEVLWTRDLGAPVKQLQAFSRGLLLASTLQQVYILDGESKVKARYSAGERITQVKVEGGRRIVIGTERGNIHVLEPSVTDFM
ncbi:MAG: hypothetical protein AYL32_010940 [Candidatus Bathyarchaeota archaeon B26-2]|nr:MAG: hypothetical protein AYL32_010940 [Candidatus Bathyarchaeota archaeon B26-2]